MSIKKVCFLALLSTLLVITKFALQSIPFVELVTLLFIIYGLTLTLKENWLVFSIFFITNIAINGFGLYWLPYLVIFPLTFSLANCFKDYRQRYLIGSLLAINCGFLIFASYFIYDAILFGMGYAIVSGTRGFWFNFLEGLINSLAVFFIGIPLIKVIEYTKRRLFNQDWQIEKFSTILTRRKKFILSGALLLFLGTFSIIPYYLFGNGKKYSQNQNSGLNSTKSIKNNKSTIDSTSCKVIYKNNHKTITDVVKNCNQYKTFGAYLDSLNPKIWDVHFIASRATDLNLDGKKDRFIGSINNNVMKFQTTNMCPAIYINNSLSPVGADMLKMANGNYYQLVFSSSNC